MPTKLKHKWTNRKYSKTEPTFTETCEQCGAIKKQRYQVPYGIEYIDTESGEVTEHSNNCKAKQTNQLEIEWR